MEEEHPGSKFHFSLSKWLEQWPPSLTGRRTRGWTCEAGTGNVWEFPGVSKVSGESLGQRVRPGTALSTHIGSFLNAKTVTLRGGEGSLTVVTNLESERKQHELGQGGLLGWKWGRLAMVWGLQKQQRVLLWYSVSWLLCTFKTLH